MGVWVYVFLCACMYVCICMYLCTCMVFNNDCVSSQLSTFHFHWRTAFLS